MQVSTDTSAVVEVALLPKGTWQRAPVETQENTPNTCTVT